MRLDRLDRIEERLLTLESSIDSLNARLARVQAQLPSTVPPRVAPPVFQRLETPEVKLPDVRHARPVAPSEPAWDLSRASADQKSASTSEERHEASNWNFEYWMGTQVGLKLGAVLTLLAIVTFVRWGYNEGWLTPAMIFAGEILFCVVFLVLGFIKKDEREDLGQILTAIGSGGLYATFAGGHLVQDLYDGQTLVTLFMGLSLGNLAYATWRVSRPFWYLGLFGGLVAAALPLDENRYTLNAVLNLLIIAPAALIAAKKRWGDAAAMVWAAGLLALIPYLFSSPEPSWWQLATLYVASLICALAYLATARPNTWDYAARFGGLMALATGLLAFGVYREPVGALHLLLFGLVFGSMGLLKMVNKEARTNLSMVAVATAAGLAPFCFEHQTAMFTFFASSIALGLLSLKRAPRPLAYLAAQQLALGMLAYCFLWLVRTDYNRWEEIGILCTAMAASLATFFSFFRSGVSLEKVVVLGSLLAGPMFSRIFVLALNAPEIGLSMEEARALSYILVTLGLAAIVRVRSLAAAAALMLVAYAVSAGLYVYMLVHTGTSWWFDASLAASVGVSAVLVSSVSRNYFHGEDLDYLFGIASMVVAGLAIRISWLLLTLPFIGLTDAEGTVYGSALVALAFACVGWYKRTPVALPGLLSALGVGMVATVAWEGIPSIVATAAQDPARAFLATSAIGLALLAGTRVGVRLLGPRIEVLIVPALAGLILVGRWAVLGFQSAFPNVTEGYALSFGWVLYGVILLALGFRYGSANLRWIAMPVFGVTVGKVLLVDMAGADLGLKFGVLLALGLTILGGGYWYIRSRGRLGLGM